MCGDFWISLFEVGSYPLKIGVRRLLCVGWELGIDHHVKAVICEM